MCNKIKCAIQYTVDLINNNINRDVQEEWANRLYRVYTHTPGIYTYIHNSIYTIVYCINTITIVSARNRIMQLYSKPEGDLDVTEVCPNLLSYSLEELG